MGVGVEMAVEFGESTLDGTISQWVSLPLFLRRREACLYIIRLIRYLFNGLAGGIRRRQDPLPFPHLAKLNQREIIIHNGC